MKALNTIPLIVGSVMFFYGGYLIRGYQVPPELKPVIIVEQPAYFTPNNTEQCGIWCITEGVEDGYKMELGQ